MLIADEFPHERFVLFFGVFHMLKIAKRVLKASMSGILSFIIIIAVIGSALLFSMWFDSLMTKLFGNGGAFYWGLVGFFALVASWICAIYYYLAQSEGERGG